MISTSVSNITFKVLGREDIEDIRRIRNLVSNNLTVPQQINELEQEKWFANMSADSSRQYFAILRNDVVVGCIWYESYSFTNSSCRVGLFIDPAFQGRKIGTIAMETFIKYLHDSFGMHRIWCFVLENNLASLNLFRKIGFIDEGVQREAIFRNGVYNNYIMLARIYG
jgi:RimJ/RimL family protein N-acetyltransferase